MVKLTLTFAVLLLFTSLSFSQTKLIADENALYFINGKLPVKKGSFWGFVDISGNKLLDFIIPESLENIKEIPQPVDNHYIQNDPVSKLSALVNSNGLNKTGLIYNRIVGFSENIGVALKQVTVTKGSQQIQTSQPTYINQSGQLLFKLSPQIRTENGFLLTWDFFDNFGLFHEGLASVPAFNKSLPGSPLYGYINTLGKTIIKPSFVNAEDFCEGVAFVSRYNSYAELKWGAVDKTGRVIIPFQFTNKPSNFSSGLSRIKATNGKYGFINKQGVIVIEPNYDWATVFQNNVAAAGNFIFNQEGYLDASLINRNNIRLKNISQYHFAGILFPENPVLSNGMIKCKGENDLYGAIDITGTVRVPFKFIRLENFSYNRAYAETETKKGFVDTNGNWVFEIVPTQF